MGPLQEKLGSTVALVTFFSFAKGLENNYLQEQRDALYSKLIATLIENALEGYRAVRAALLRVEPPPRPLLARLPESLEWCLKDAKTSR